MTQGPKLKVLMPRIAGQRFSCHSCAGCCRDTVVPLTADDLGRIEAQEWSQMIDVEPAVRMDDGWALNKRRDGSCVFLDEAGLCRIHARHGPKSKPAACRLFPLSIRPEAGGRWRAWLRFDCPSVARSQGRAVSQQLEEVDRLVRQLGCREGVGAGDPEFRRGMGIGPRSIGVQ